MDGKGVKHPNIRFTQSCVPPWQHPNWLVDLLWWSAAFRAGCCSVVRILDHRSKGSGFNSCPVHCFRWKPLFNEHIICQFFLKCEVVYYCSLGDRVFYGKLTYFPLSNKSAKPPKGFCYSIQDLCFDQSMKYTPHDFSPGSSIHLSLSLSWKLGHT